MKYIWLNYHQCRFSLGLGKNINGSSIIPHNSPHSRSFNFPAQFTSKITRLFFFFLHPTRKPRTKLEVRYLIQVTESLIFTKSDTLSLYLLSRVSFSRAIGNLAYSRLCPIDYLLVGMLIVDGLKSNTKLRYFALRRLLSLQIYQPVIVVKKKPYFFNSRPNLQKC